MDTLFGVSAERFQQERDAAADAQALQYARLSPIEKASFGVQRGAYGLAGALGGALGGTDPELQRRTQAQQILGMINPSNPETFFTAAQIAADRGDQQLAFGLRLEGDKYKQQKLIRDDEAQTRADRLLARQQATQAQAIAQTAYQPGTAEQAIPERAVVDEAADTSYLEPERVVPAVAPSFDIQRVAPILMRTAAGRAELKNLVEAQKLTRPEVKEIKNREKLIERTPTGGWKIVPISGQPEVSATSENAIQTLISSNAIHPSVVPYAQQISKRFTTIDPEDQDKLMQTLTQLNNTATEKEANRTAQQSTAVAANASRLLTQELIKLNIEEAKRKAEAAADGKPIGINESTKLAERAQSADKLVSIYESFKPEFAGFATDRVGDAALLIAGKSKDPKSVDLFQWWQGYQENINKVRNELFGAALTAPEKAEFEKAMVTKGMSPEQAATNLKRQAELAINAYNKIDNVLRVQGFSKSGLNALKPMGIRPGLENFVLPNPANPASK